MPGPAPKRSDQRRRRNAPEIPIETAPSEGYTVDWGEPDANWHPLCRETYIALQKSPQVVYATQADVAQARITMHVWTEQLNRPGGPSGQALSALFSSLDNLMLSEAARRRARIEVAKMQKEAPPDVPDDLAARRKRAAGGG